MLFFADWWLLIKILTVLIQRYTGNNLFVFLNMSLKRNATFVSGQDTGNISMAYSLSCTGHEDDVSECSLVDTNCSASTGHGVHVDCAGNELTKLGSRI